MKNLRYQICVCNCNKFKKKIDQNFEEEENLEVGHMMMGYAMKSVL